MKRIRRIAYVAVSCCPSPTSRTREKYRSLKLNRASPPSSSTADANTRNRLLAAKYAETPGYFRKLRYSLVVDLGRSSRQLPEGLGQSLSTSRMKRLIILKVRLLRPPT